MAAAFFSAVYTHLTTFLDINTDFSVAQGITER